MATKVVRKKESRLIWLAALVMTAGLSLIFLSTGKRFALSYALIGVAFFGLFLLTHYLLQWMGHQGDELILPLMAVLTSLGLIMLFRLKEQLMFAQFSWLVVGLGSMLIVMKFLPEPGVLSRYKYVFALIGIGLLLVTIIFGTEVGGAKNWVKFGRFTVQPAEVVKLFFVVFLAGYLEEKKELLGLTTKLFGLPGLQYLGPLLLMWSLAIMLLIFQKDLGTALLFFGTFLAMFYVATGRVSLIALGLALFFLGSTILYQIFNHVRIRVEIWVNPWKDIDGAGYQIVQSLFSLGTGGVFGTGIGQGHPDMIPAVHTDFIFAAIGEELGLLGTIAVIILYLLLFTRGFRTAIRAKDDFNGLLAAGLTALLALQTFVIIGGVTKLIPLTGVTLPFMSYGGSSLLTNFILCGLLLNISQVEG